jgi:hypothetical protein
MAARANVLERPASKPATYLRDHRLRISAWIGGGEGLITLLFGTVAHVAVYILAVVAIGFYVATGRNYTSPTARQLTWIFAASQAVAVLVPVVYHFVKFTVELAVVIVAIVGLGFLFWEHRRN